MNTGLFFYEAGQDKTFFYLFTVLFSFT